MGFGYKNKAKVAIGKKIIAVFLDNYIQMKNGTEVDEWGKNWKEKSFNEAIAFFRDNEQNFKLKAKFQFVPMRMGSLVKDLDNLSIYDAYRFI